MKNKTRDIILIILPACFFWLVAGYQVNFCFDFWFVTITFIAILSFAIGLTSLIMRAYE